MALVIPMGERWIGPISRELDISVTLIDKIYCFECDNPVGIGVGGYSLAAPRDKANASKTSTNCLPIDVTPSFPYQAPLIRSTPMASSIRIKKSSSTANSAGDTRAR